MRIGEALAEARGRAGLSVAEVSQRTRIREAIITGIEHDDYSACGGDFYARGNIRSIAKAVGADSEPLIAEYDSVHRTPGVLSAVSLDELPTLSQAPGRRPRNWAMVLGLALVAAAVFVGYTFLTGSPHAGSAPPAAANRELTHGGRGRAPATPEPGMPILRTDHTAAAALSPRHSAPRKRMGPAATVRAYIAAINGHHYSRAWRLGGRNTGGSYASFVGGFNGTARDTLTIMSVWGEVVTARLSAQQTDGSVDTYQGTYTVHHGVIIGSDVLQVS